MSRAQLREVVEPLPPKLRDEILDYAAFVETIVGERAEAMGYSLERPEEEDVVLLSAVLHLRDVVAGQLALARMAASGPPDVQGSPGAPSVSGLQAGRADIAPGSAYIRQLNQLRRRIDRLFVEAGIPPSASRVSDAVQLVAARG